MYLIISTPSIDYANAISHELWMLARPRGISDNETSQFLCGRYAHPDKTQVAIGPINDPQYVHANADEQSFANLISPAITDEEEQAIVAAIVAAKGGYINILSIIQSSPSLAPNLRTRDQLKASGWFPTQEV